MVCATRLPEIRFALGEPQPGVTSLDNAASAPEPLPIGLQHGDARQDSQNGNLLTTIEDIPKENEPALP